MSWAWAQMVEYWAYPFVRHALLAGAAISICASLLGVTLVLRRYSYIGDGLSHVAFGAMAIATVLGIHNDVVVVLPVTMAVSVLLLCAGAHSTVRGDAALAMLSVGAVAFGYFILNVFPTASANISGDVCSALFGSTSILTLSTFDVWFCAACSLVVIALFAIFHRIVFSVTFDPVFAAASGIRTGLYNIFFSLVVAAVIVLAMQLVGALLVAALVVFPALSAMAFCRSFLGAVVASAALSLICTLLGLLTSILAGTPVGATIVLTQTILFLLCRCVIQPLLGRRK